MKLYDSRISLGALAIAMAFIAYSRLSQLEEKAISWDVLGYYLPLPATFIYDDPMMDDRTWVEKKNEEYQLTGTVYQVSSNDEGESMYFFLFGMSLFYLPFFLMGHGWAALSGAPMDGFSPPYHYALIIGGIVYTIIGLMLLRKILLRYYSHGVTAITLLVVVLATNYSLHMTFKNLETVNILFTLMCWLLWSTIRWHEEYRFRHLLQAGIAVTLMALVKPSEVLAIFLPLLWGVTSWAAFREKLRMLRKYRRQLLITIAGCFLIALPQMLYWYSKTGHFIYDSYKNPGIGLDLFSPHIFDVLFSYRKGWLVYTPVMLLGLAGLIVLYRRNKAIGLSLLVYFVVAFYIICSWTEWWYGGSFSCRPVITAYPILALGIAAVLTAARKLWAKAALGTFIVLCLALNQFQEWQLMHGILDPYRTTKAYYWAAFLKTEVPANAEELKLVFRSFEPNQPWTDRDRYRVYYAKELVKGAPKWDEEEFPQIKFEEPYRKLTPGDHAWMEMEVEYETPDTAFAYGPFLVGTMLYDGQAYNWGGGELKLISDTLGNNRYRALYRVMTPNVRTQDDLFQSYVWNPSKNRLKVHSFKVRSYCRK